MTPGVPNYFTQSDEITRPPKGHGDMSNAANEFTETELEWFKGGANQ